MLANGGTVAIDSASVSGAGTYVIADGGTADFRESNANLNVSFVGAGTLELGQSQSYTGTVTGFGAGDALDLDDLSYNTITPTDNTVTWTQSTNTLAIRNGTQTVDIKLAGTYTTADFLTTKGSGNTTQVDFLEPDFWAQLQYPAILLGEHNFGVDPQFDLLQDFVALAYNDALDYATSDTSYTVTQNIELLDPFFLPSANFVPQTVATLTVQAPERDNLIVPNIDVSGSVDAEGIFVYTGTDALYQVIGTRPGDAGSVSFSTPTEIGDFSTTGETIFNLKEAFRQSDSIASSFAIVWDQFAGTSGTSGAYNLEIQLDNINSDGSFTPTAILSVALDSNVAETDLPAWDFKPGGGAYVLAVAESDTATSTMLNLHTTHDAIQFTGYTLNGGGTAVVTDSTSFTLQPDLVAYTADTDVSNEIVQPIIASLSQYPGQSAQALQFIESSDNGNDYFVVWNETITSSGTPIGDQVEVAAIKPGSGSVAVEARAEFQIADGQAQNVRVGEFTDPVNSSQDDVVVVYGDDTGTHIIEYDVTNDGATVNPLTSFTDPTTQAFGNLTILGNGLIAITYDDLIDSSTGETSQFDFKLFDLARAGLDLTPADLSSTEANYIAGTQYNDTVTGVSGVNNLYYFVGQATNGSGSTDSFTGGASGTGWNIAIFPDARSDYSITTNVSDITNIVSNGDDPLHTGSLAVSNVQILAFDPVNDPTPQNNTIDVTGGTYVILGDETAPITVTIQAGATAELDITASGASTYTGPVAFAATTGTLVLDQPGDFNGTISGISGSGDVIDLVGYDTGTTVTPGTYSGGDTILTVDDSGQATLLITLVGNYSDTTWLATADASNTGVDIYDPPAAAVIAAGASLDISAPSNETVKFDGGTGALVLNDPESFTGQIVGFTGTAPDAAHSDTIDLVGINYNSSGFAETYNSATGLLTVTDGTNSASITFDDFNATLDFASDSDGGTLITDPPATSSSPVQIDPETAVLSAATADGANGSLTIADASHSDTPSASFAPDGTNYLGDFSLNQATVSDGHATVSWEFDFDNQQVTLAPGQTLTQSYNVTVANAQNPAANVNQTISVSIGGPGNDHFVFAPGIGADTITNFNPQHDTIELDHFAAAQNVQELAALVTTDVHGDAVINLGHNDSITLPGVTDTQLQQVIQAGHVLLH